MTLLKGNYIGTGRRVRSSLSNTFTKGNTYELYEAKDKSGNVSRFSCWALDDTGAERRVSKENFELISKDVKDRPKMMTSPKYLVGIRNIGSAFSNLAQTHAAKDEADVERLKSSIACNANQEMVVYQAISYSLPHNEEYEETKVIKKNRVIHNWKSAE